MNAEPFTAIIRAVRSPDPAYRITGAAVPAILYAPVALIAAFFALLVCPPSHYFAIRLLNENGPVELLTFVFALAGGLLSARIAVQAAWKKDSAIVPLFFALFAAGMIFIAGEEIAWGQQFFKFPTPESWRAMNSQGETTPHNLVSIQGHTELIRIAFGVGGLVGIFLSAVPRFRSIGAPAVLLLWFIVITGHSIVDELNDMFPISPRIDFYINKFSEMTEMFIAMAGFLYAWLNGRMLKGPAKG